MWIIILVWRKEIFGEYKGVLWLRYPAGHWWACSRIRNRYFCNELFLVPITWRGLIYIALPLLDRSGLMDKLGIGERGRAASEAQNLTDAGAVNFKKTAWSLRCYDIPLCKIVFCLRSDHNARERDRVIIWPAITYLSKSRPKELLDQSDFALSIPWP